MLRLKRMCAVSAGWEGVCGFEWVWVERKDWVTDRIRAE